VSHNFGRIRQGLAKKMDATCQVVRVPCATPRVMPHVSRKWIDELDVSPTEGEENGFASPPPMNPTHHETI
jgi:hypothetical protein